jgi:hypothetical protein
VVQLHAVHQEAVSPVGGNAFDFLMMCERAREPL